MGMHKIWMPRRTAIAVPIEGIAPIEHIRW